MFPVTLCGDILPERICIQIVQLPQASIYVVQSVARLPDLFPEPAGDNLADAFQAAGSIPFRSIAEFCGTFLGLMKQGLQTDNYACPVSEIMPGEGSAVLSSDNKVTVRQESCLIKKSSSDLPL